MPDVLVVKYFCLNRSLIWVQRWWEVEVTFCTSIFDCKCGKLSKFHECISCWSSCRIKNSSMTVPRLISHHCQIHPHHRLHGHRWPFVESCGEGELSLYTQTIIDNLLEPTTSVHQHQTQADWNSRRDSTLHECKCFIEWPDKRTHKIGAHIPGLSVEKVFVRARHGVQPHLWDSSKGKNQ